MAVDDLDLSMSLDAARMLEGRVLDDEGNVPANVVEADAEGSVVESMVVECMIVGRMIAGRKIVEGTCLNEEGNGYRAMKGRPIVLGVGMLACGYDHPVHLGRIRVVRSHLVLDIDSNCQSVHRKGLCSSQDS